MPDILRWIALALSLTGMLGSAAVLLEIRRGSVSRAFAQTVPVILNVTESAGNGEVFQLQGHGFTADSEVWLRRVLGSGTPITPDFEADTLVMSARGYATARMPAMEAPDLMAVFVKDGSSVSQPRYINRARINHVEHEAIGSGQAFRVWGRNLKLTSGTPTVRLVSGGTTLTTTVTGSQETQLDLVAPQGIVPGTVYEIHVSNGLGGQQGFSVAAETITGRTAGLDPFNLGVPWGADFTYAGTVRQATCANVQAQIDASTAAGGVVQLPSGTCTLSGPLTLKSNVVLRGAGPTTILKRGGRVVNVPNGTRVAGLLDVRVESIGGGDATPIHLGGSGFSNTLSSNQGTGADRVFVKGVEIVSGPTGEDNGGFELYDWENVLLADIDVQATNGHVTGLLYATRGDYLTVRDSTFVWHDKRSHIEDSSHVVWDGNTLTKDYTLSPGGPVSGEFFDRGGINAECNRHVAWLESTWRTTPRQDIWTTNDGEALNRQCNSKHRYTVKGTATGGTPTTLVDSSKTFSPPNRHYSVTLTEGTGWGQTRRITGQSGGTVTVTPAWDVAPTAGTNYIVHQWDTQHDLVRGSTFTDGTTANVYYGGAYDAAMIGSIVTNNGMVTMRAIQRSSGVVEHGPIWGILLQGNRITNTVNPPAKKNASFGLFFHHTDPAEGHGTYALGLVVRDNEIDATANVSYDSPSLRDGYWAATSSESGAGGSDNGTSSDPSDMGAVNVIFERNTARDTQAAYQVGSGGYNVAIACPTYANVTTQVQNRVGPNHTAGAADLVQLGCDAAPTPTLTPVMATPTNTPTTAPTNTPTPLPTGTATPTPATTATPTPTACTSLCIVRVELWNAQTNVKVRDVVPGDIIDYSVLGTTQIAFKAVTNPDSQAAAGSVRFFLNDTLDQNENAWPFFSEGDCWGCNPPDVTQEAPQLNGTYILKAQAFSGASGGGTAGTPLVLTITVQN